MTSVAKDQPKACRVPSCGSEAIRKVASAAAVRTTAASSERPGHCRERAARAGTAKTMPQMTIGCTSASGPFCMAEPWKTKPRMPSTWPTSQAGRPSRWVSRPTGPRADSGAAPAAWCCTEVEKAVVKALARANAIASQVTLVTLNRARDGAPQQRAAAAAALGRADRFAAVSPSPAEDRVHLAFLGCGFITGVHSRHLKALRGDVVASYASRDLAQGRAVPSAVRRPHGVRRLRRGPRPTRPWTRSSSPYLPTGTSS